MRLLHFFALLLITAFVACEEPSRNLPNLLTSPKNASEISPPDLSAKASSKGVLLLTDFKSLEELKEVIRIEYFKNSPEANLFSGQTPAVRLTQSGGSQKVVSLLESGISEKDILKAWTGSLFDRVWLGLNNPYLIINKRNLPRIFNLARRRPIAFGEGDVAFFDLAETMLYHISEEDFTLLNSEDLSEKGFINTFNHVTSQAFMTSILSEKFADFIADTHERANMPELISGDFTEEQLMDMEAGPVDNYVDIINNEWGQELGKQLAWKYNINQQTHWTPELLTNYLNDIQGYFSWAFQVGFEPFREDDRLVIKFAKKINIVLEDVTGFRYKKEFKKRRLQQKAIRQAKAKN